MAVGQTQDQDHCRLLAPNRNAGPVFAAIGIAFANDPAILGAATAIMLIGTVISILFASFLARKRVVAEGAPAPANGSHDGGATGEPGDRIGGDLIIDNSQEVLIS